MEQWLDRAQNSSDIRDRIAVANGISRGQNLIFLNRIVVTVKSSGVQPDA